MVKIKTSTKEFKKMIQTAACKGTVQFTPTTKETRDLFDTFIIDAKNDKLEILEIDTYYNNIKQHLISFGVEVEEEGTLEITSKDLLKKALDGIQAKDLFIKDEGNKIVLVGADGKDEYKIKQEADEKDMVDSIDIQREKKSSLVSWRDMHSKVDEEGKIVVKLTTDQGSALYPMKILTKQEKLSKLSDDVIKITEDNDTVIKAVDGKVEMFSGKPNDMATTRHVLEHEAGGIEWIDFKCSFSALQAIIPHLLKNVTIHIRQRSDGYIILRFECEEGNLHQVISIGSQTKNEL